MSTAIVVAAVSGVFSLAAIVGSLLSSRNVARLSSELEERREVRSKEERAAELRARYRDPLLGAVFVRRRALPEFNRWFQKLECDLKLLAAEPREHLVRPVLLQNALIDILEIMDPDCGRFPLERRARLDLAVLGNP